ncbi:MAG TPA: alpha/beta hydrolase [Thermoleophilaceae bacterium]|nr:alpha/beta hydrolase [Thermoleophilaceae bacterium]
MALQIAARGRARSLVALSPAGGWADDSWHERLEFFTAIHAQLQGVAAYADAIAASPDGRRRATQFITERSEHIPADLIAHQIVGAARCETPVLVDAVRRIGYQLETARVDCPVRILWGTADKLLEWPTAAALFQEELPGAEWIPMDGVGHCPQLDVPAEAAELILGLTAP